MVPIDFSDHSVTAAQHAGALARRFHSEVVLLHVNEFPAAYPLAGPLGFGITSTEAEQAEQVERRRKQLEEFGANELSGLPVKRVIRSGDPAELIVECARAEKSDLILMPTRGYGVFRRFLLGSVTAKVLHDAECPVWTGVHLADSSPVDLAEVRLVMCAVDFGPESIKAIRWAADFASEFDAKLAVVHTVVDAPPNLPERYMFQWHEEAHWGAEERLRILLLDSGIHAEILVVSDGDIPKSISQAAVDKGAQLLVIGRCCEGHPEKRLGAHTLATICQAPCPVVSV
ncbi:MAG TPA: universal stress protein [Bryobacteraceae bacterium]|nr:universal stress protein [Bryobacteraceae bacterium]